jgi:Trypsin-co-occurring domain 1
MANLVRVQTSSGPILIEVNRADTAARQVVTATDRIIDAVETLGAGFDKLVAFSSDFAGSVKKLGKKARKAELEIGFELTAEGSFFFASAAAGATFSAKIEFDLEQ